MKKISCSIALMLLFGPVLMAQGDVSQARWQAVRIVADGNNNEWKKPFSLYDRLSGLIFSIANDSTHLFICFTANDERKINKLMRAGWVVEVSSKEKDKKFAASIVFPEVEMINAAGKPNDVLQGVRSNFKSGFDMYKLNVIGVTAKGFVSANGGIALQNVNGINIGLGTDSTQKMIVELAIPFKELFAGNNAALSEEMMVSVTVNKIPKPKYSATITETGTKHGLGGTDTDRDIYAAEKAGLYEKTNFKQKFRLNPLSLRPDESVRTGLKGRPGSK